MPDILTEAMDTEIEFVHKLSRKPKRKKKHETEDESDEAKKKKTVHSYKLDMEVITMIIQKGGIDKLPTPHTNNPQHKNRGRTDKRRTPTATLQRNLTSSTGNLPFPQTYKT